MKSGLTPWQLFSGTCGVVLIAILHLTTPYNFTGYGPNGVDWLTLVFSGFWFGVVGFGGGMLAYAIGRRLFLRDPLTFHRWSIACVKSSKLSGNPIPTAVIDYLRQNVDLEWASSIGLSPTSPEVAAIKTAQEARFALMRYQLSLDDSDKGFFVDQATAQGR